jgi:regulator of protease activity HflC (stomatin/prohibitin superfamily)
MAEKPTRTLSGYIMLALGLVIVVVAGILYSRMSAGSVLLIIPPLLILLAIFIFAGLFIVNPNDAKVTLLFGSYAGTVRQNGFFWANPFYTKKKFSLRARNLSGQKLKVNDKVGNPIEIAVVIVWQVFDTFKAAFDVDNFEQYVVIQSEAAVRHLAQSYPYDSFEDEGREQGLTLLSERHLVELDEERRAAMISNLLVVLCSESAAAPVINAGTLYQ